MFELNLMSNKKSGPKATWTKLTFTSGAPVSLLGGRGAFKNNKIYLYGGVKGSSVNSQTFDTASLAWTNLPQRADSVFSCLGAVGNSIVNVFGMNGGRDIVATYLFDLSWNQTTGASAGVSKTYFSHGAVGDKFYIVGTNAASYDAVANTWMSLGKPPTLVGHDASGGGAGTNFFVSSANTGAGATNTLFRLDTVALQWAEVKQGLPSRVQASPLAYCKGYLYQYGGTLTSGGALLKSLLKIDPVTGNVEEMGGLPSDLPATSRSVLVSDGESMWLYGGVDASNNWMLNVWKIVP